MSDFKKQPPIQKKTSTVFLGFLGGLSACHAEMFTFPFDSLKTRMQMNGKDGMPSYLSTRDCIQQTFKSKGIQGFYKGISAALMRQLTYSTVRMWAYEKINRYFCADVQKVGFFRKLFAAGLGGAVGCLVGTPFDIFKIRLINDINGVKYKGLIDCAKVTIKNDGYEGIFKGLNVNILRAILVNAGELAFYDKSKNFFRHQFVFKLEESSLANQFLSSCVAGFMGALLSSPADVVKTRYMNQLKGSNTYTSIASCFIQITKQEGLFAFYKGFIPLYVRIAPWNVIFFLSYEKYKTLFVYERIL